MPQNQFTILVGFKNDTRKGRCVCVLEPMYYTWSKARKMMPKVVMVALSKAFRVFK